MPNINLRGVEAKTLNQLKLEAHSHNVSVNTLILQLIDQSLGIARKRSKPTYHDLDQYAGTWTEKDEVEFFKATKAFSDIDDELWQ